MQPQPLFPNWQPIYLCFRLSGSRQSLRRLSRLLTILLGLGLGLLPTIAIAQQRHALLVAVSEYKRPEKMSTLKFAEADALAIRDILTRADGTGYEVTLLVGKDATKVAVQAALEEIAKKGEVGDHLILGFFGHGVQYGADAYFCPFDTNLRTVVDANGKAIFNGNAPQMQPDEKTMVSMKEMLTTMTLSDAKHKLLLADCCREDPTRARGRAFGSSLKLEELPKNSAAMFACDEKEQAYELDEKGHGAFTQAFLDAFENSENPTVNELSVSVARGVEKLVQPKGVKQNVNTLISGRVVELGMVNRIAPVKSNTEMRSPSAPKLNEPASAIETIRNSIDMQLAPIPRGEFWMGSTDDDKDRFKDEVRRKVTISKPFYMSITEVTQAQYQAVMKSNPSAVKQPEHPVESVSWNDARQFCEALSALPKEKAAGRVYRLPTEAEWEYACRAGEDTRFTFGDDPQRLPEFAWFKGNANGSQSFPVMQKQPNARGLFDIHGNVYEWCSDWYEAKPSTKAVSDPTGPANGSERVMRGGSFREDAKFLRSASRMSYPPQASFPFAGFRVVMEQTE